MSAAGRYQRLGLPPIGSYAVLSELRTTALIGVDGSVDWFPFPSLDSPPASAALADPAEGGRMS